MPLTTPSRATLQPFAISLAAATMLLSLGASQTSYAAMQAPGYSARMSVNTSTMSHSVARAAIDALQKGDPAAWSALFEPNATFYDDGAPRSLAEFTKGALGHERFTSIDKVSGDGLEITGHFHSDRWGDFRTYFRFHLSPAGRIARLDIGQA